MKNSIESMRFGAELLINVWVVVICVWEAERVLGAEQNLALSDAANFLDAGLTALGLLTALVITVMRGRLDSENNTRDLLSFLAGKKANTVKLLLQCYVQVHSLSTALLLVEHTCLLWAQEMFLYYGAVTGKTVDLIPAKWLHPDNYPSQQTERCKCPGGPLRCKCLVFLHVEGVVEHLVAVAQGGVFRVDDKYDGVISESCRRSKCHGFESAVYQTAGAGSVLGAPPPIQSSAEAALWRSIGDLNVEEEGKTGAVLIDPANDNSVEWADSILQASVTKDASERGSENPFTRDYSRALQGQEGLGTGRQEMNDAAWWLSRVGAFLLSCTLVLLFRTDAFSSILLARRALRGYILDATGTKLPLESFCKVAQCQGVAGERRTFVVFKPKDNFILRYPHRALWTGMVFEAVVVLLWFAAVALTPWFHPAGASYIQDGHNWTMALGAAIALITSFINAWWCFTEKPGNKWKWALVASLCGSVDAGILTLAILWICNVARGHGISTGFRCLMLIAALLQWVLGVETLGAVTSQFRGQSTKIIIPYTLTYLRLLALVAGAGSWT